MKRRGATFDTLHVACELKLRAERRLGELLAAAGERRGRVKCVDGTLTKGTPPSLPADIARTGFSFARQTAYDPATFVQRINDWLQDHQTAVAVLGPAGVALSALGVRFAPSGGWIAVCVVLLALFAATPSIAARVNRLQQSRRAAEHCTKEVLEACAYAMGYPGIHIRVNIMRFSSDRQRRKVHTATAFNMDRDPDYDLEMGVTAGVGGQAVSSRRPTIGDISLPPQPGGPDWGLSDAEKARVRPTLKSILGVPVFNPRDTNGPLLATLQVDSDLPLGESGLEDEQKREVAQRFADVVSLLLEVSR